MTDLQARRLARAFGLPIALARILAALHYGEGRE
jgi:hypothetical protein